MRGRDQISEFVRWVTNDHLRFIVAGFDLWAVSGHEAFARWWADPEFRRTGYWVNGEGVFKMAFTDRDEDHLLCSRFFEWNPTEPQEARHCEVHPDERAPDPDWSDPQDGTSSRQMIAVPVRNRPREPLPQYSSSGRLCFDGCTRGGSPGCLG